MRLTSGRHCRLVGLLTLLTWHVASQAVFAQSSKTITIRGRQQTLRLYGSPNGTPIIVSSGDGGWIHLSPHVAEFLSGKGYFVVGFDVRSYLAGFTTGGDTLRAV